MRFWLRLPLTLLAAIPLSYTAQVAFQEPERACDPPTTCTIAEVLYADPDYISLVKLLQATKLIPTLNSLSGSTLFAPTNDALGKQGLWQAASDDLSRDNLQDKLRQQLFYHLLNYSLEIPPTEKHPQVHKTLLYPHVQSHTPTHEPPPYPPWLPVPNGTLGERPQLLRASHRDESMWVGVDVFGEGGVRVLADPVNASNGFVYKVGGMLEMPPDIATVVSRRTSFPYFSSPEIATFLNSTPELTVFLPADAAWDALPYYEKLYLQSPFASDDLHRIARMHAVQGVMYGEDLSKVENVTSVHGHRLHIDEKHVASAEFVENDIYASNGVVHTISELLVPEGALRLTTEKYLLTLNCTAFISLLHSVDLTGLVNGTNAHYTVLAPQDDVISLFGDGELPEKGSEELKKMLQYHFIPGKWTPEKLGDGMLLETALEEPGLGGGKQVLSVEVSGDPKGKDDKSPTIRFGGAGIIGEHVMINNTIIYFVSRPLIPPADALTTALPELELSTILAAIFSTTLAETLKTTPRTTFLLPPNAAFKRLGLLVSAHLLSASYKSDLERVIQHHALVGVEYEQAFVNGSQRTYQSLEGSDIHVERPGNGSVIISASGGWAGMHSALLPKDMLTQTGVIHEVSDIMIPRSVDITIGKLIKAAKGSTMATMMTKAGLDWILNGTAPPEDSQWAEMGLSGSGWTVLCPTDDALKHVNLTELYANQDQLVNTVTQHLIPPTFARKSNTAVLDALNNNRPIVLDDSAVYNTLYTYRSIREDGNVVFVNDADDEGTGTLVGVKGARGENGQDDRAHVLGWGRSTTARGTGGVIQIDRMLQPYYPPWWRELLPPIVVGTVLGLLIIVFFYGIYKFWQRDAIEATYEPIGGFAEESSDD